MIAGGYAGRILEVDLARKELHTSRPDEETLRKYIGGTGLAAKMLWDETTKDIAPLSPEAPLLFMIGPLTGTAMPFSSRYTVAGISPLTGIWGESHSGGDWPDELKHAGFDGIVLRGKADRPVYLWLHDGQAEIRDAGHVWGKDTYEVDDLLRAETDADARVAAIGPAGERLVRIACIMNDGRMGRAAARCGFGALMGSKNLKAIVVRGRGEISYADKQRFKEIVAKVYAARPPRNHVAGAVEGSVARWKGYLGIGRIPTKNFQQGTFEPAYRLAEDIRNTRPYFCRHCAYGSGECRLRADGAERHMVLEHWCPLGTNCLIGDIEALEKAYAICQRYGMDTISVGGIMSFAMECYQKGLISREDTGGVELTWGNYEAMLEMVKQIGENEGFGSVLGQGARQAAEQIGGRAVEYAMHVKGLELPLHDPRTYMSLALAYATGNWGAYHADVPGAPYLEMHQGTPEAAFLEQHKLFIEFGKEIGYSPGMTPSERLKTAGKGQLVAKTQHLGNMQNSLAVCHFLMPRYMRPSQVVGLLNSATGWDMDVGEFMKTGERIFNLKRMFNVRRGISRKDDTLPMRILTLTRQASDPPETLPHLGAMLSEYYSFRGWSEEGIPTAEKLAELGLQQCLACAR
ncbi:MAG: aldehyde ferredoxin oxidoreductase family protein [Chloroflexi bacterium]|nr:aldehyde ferredoxin oxidoreductase family protein [Chloroflexota bacterium]